MSIENALKTLFHSTTIYGIMYEYLSEKKLFFILTALSIS